MAQYKWRVDEGDWTMVLDTGVSSMLDFSHDYDVGPHCLEVRVALLRDAAPDRYSAQSLSVQPTRLTVVTA
jgi:hypothetical protein